MRLSPVVRQNLWLSSGNVPSMLSQEVGDDPTNRILTVSTDLAFAVSFSMYIPKNNNAPGGHQVAVGWVRPMVLGRQRSRSLGWEMPGCCGRC